MFYIRNYTLKVFLSLLIVFPSLTFAAAQSSEIGKRGAVSSGSKEASEAGTAVMKMGGNAIDAAVATGFALAVTHPAAGNLGGGTFFVLHLEDGTRYALDAREQAPNAATEKMYQDKKGNVIKGLSTKSRLSSGVPGTVDGMLKLHERFGLLSRKQVLAPAIKLASQGFYVDQKLAAELKRQKENFSVSSASQEKFLHKGDTLPEGYLWKQKGLAKTLKKISKFGRAGFYEGDTARLIVEEMRRGNGIVSLDDLAEYQSVWRDPVVGTYRGYEIVSMPPSSSGGVLIIQILNMLEPYNLAGMGAGSASAIHHVIEAERRAYADRAEHLGDSDFYDVPLNKLMNKGYAKKRFADFKDYKASDSNKIGPGHWPKESKDTTHYSVADIKGNAVSVTTTLNFSYGNKITVSGAGFLLNNEMDDFSAKPGVANAYGLIGNVANAIEPKKRMLSSMSPSIVTKDKKTLLVTGSPGGSTIITTTLQVILNVIDFEMPLNEAVSASRFHHQWKPDKVQYEKHGFSADTLRILRGKGHKQLVEASWPLGDANSILLKGDHLEAYSDPRRRGSASVF